MGFSSAKTRKKQEKERAREKKEERYIFENHNHFEIHSVRNTVRDSAVFIIISFEIGLLLEESILSKSVLLGFFKTVYRPFFLCQSGSFSKPLLILFESRFEVFSL